MSMHDFYDKSIENVYRQKKYVRFQDISHGFQRKSGCKKCQSRMRGRFGAAQPLESQVIKDDRKSAGMKECL